MKNSLGNKYFVIKDFGNKNKYVVVTGEETETGYPVRISVDFFLKCDIFPKYSQEKLKQIIGK